MPEDLDKEIVKAAVREVMDELTVTYANGAGTFLDSAIKSLADVSDSFDEFYTNNLSKDKPAIASLFLDLRIRSAKTAIAVLQSRITALTKKRAQISPRGRLQKSSRRKTK